MSAAAHSVLNDGPLKARDHFLKFEVKGLLGKGGHAWVYHGYDAFLDRHVAIKVVPKPAEPGRDYARRAQLEARVLCRLQHPNVVHVIDAGATHEGAVYIRKAIGLAKNTTKSPGTSESRTGVTSCHRSWRAVTARRGGHVARWRGP